MRKIFILAISVLFLNACGTTSKISKETNLIKATWKLLDNDKVAKGLNNDPITLNLNLVNPHKISGFAGCNNFGGNYSAQDGFIIFSDMYNTKMACPNLKDEDHFLKLLQTANRYEVRGSKLYLFQDKILLLKFQK